MFYPVLSVTCCGMGSLGLVRVWELAEFQKAGRLLTSPQEPCGKTLHPPWDVQRLTSLAGLHILLPTDSILQRRLPDHMKVFILQTGTGKF